MKHIFTSLSLIIFSSVFTQVTLLDEGFTNGIPSTWTVIDGDQNSPTGISDYANAWISYVSPFDTCAASTSYYLNANGNEDTAAVSADYLITPQISLLTFGNLLTWDAKSLDGSFPDGYIVLVSATDSLEASFTDTIKVVNTASPYWTNYTVNLMTEGYANQDVYIAFKNNTKNGYVLQIDNVKITGDDPASVTDNILEISIYPNPVIDILNIKTSNFTHAKVIDINGRVILESNSKSLDLINLPKGIYILEVETLNGILRKRIIKA